MEARGTLLFSNLQPQQQRLGFLERKSECLEKRKSMKLSKVVVENKGS